MTLASLASAGASPERISKVLENLGIPFTLSTEEAKVNGIQALRVNVSYPEEREHRTFRDIRRLIKDAILPERASQRSIEAFRLLAVAEGAVHGRPPKDVTFHEVGAVDSIIDVVGSCVALELLEVDTVSCGPLPMGTGVVEGRPRHAARARTGNPGDTERLPRALDGRTARDDHPNGGGPSCAPLTGGEFTRRGPRR